MDKVQMRRDFRDIFKKARRYKLAKGQVIQTTEDRRVINLILSGYVKRYLIRNDGSIGIQVVYGPGDIFPITLAYQILFNQKIYGGSEVYYYETMSNAELLTLDETAFHEHIKTNPILYRSLLLEVGSRLSSTLQGLENRTLKTAHKRLAHQLLYFANRFGEPTKLGIRIKLPLTHQDIADILNLTRETVSTSMVQLKKDGFIISGRYIIVPNIAKLEKTAYS